MRDLFFYILGTFTGMFIMCASSICKKELKNLKKRS